MLAGNEKEKATCESKAKPIKNAQDTGTAQSGAYNLYSLTKFGKQYLTGKIIR